VQASQLFIFTEKVRHGSGATLWREAKKVL
jgi:hypothetical protein